MDRIIVLSVSVFFCLVLSAPVEAVFVATQDGEDTFQEAKKQTQAYEQKLGLVNETASEGFVDNSEIPLEMRQARIQMKKEREKIIREKNQREKEQNEMMQREIEKLKIEIQRVEKGEFNKDPLSVSRTIFFFQIGFLLLCAGAVFPFIYKKGKLVDFLNK